MVQMNNNAEPIVHMDSANNTPPQTHMPGDPLKKGSCIEGELQTIAREFVRQYYTMLSVEPEHVHRFYSNDSKFTPSHLEHPVRGQQAIQNELKNMNFVDSRVKIHGIKASEVKDTGILIQVMGELSNNNEAGRRFMQSFVLCQQGPKKFYALNDIFAYVDELYSPLPPQQRTRGTSHTQPAALDDSVESAEPQPPVTYANGSAASHELNNQTQTLNDSSANTPVAQHQMSAQAPVFMPAAQSVSPKQSGNKTTEVAAAIAVATAAPSVNSQHEQSPAPKQKTSVPSAAAVQPVTVAVPAATTTQQSTAAVAVTPVLSAPEPQAEAPTVIVPEVTQSGPKTWANIASRNASAPVSVVQPVTRAPQLTPQPVVPAAATVTIAQMQTPAVPADNASDQSLPDNTPEAGYVIENCPYAGRAMPQAFMKSLPVPLGRQLRDLEQELGIALKKIGCNTTGVRPRFDKMRGDRAFAFVDFASPADGDKLFNMCKRKVSLQARENGGGQPPYTVSLMFWGQQLNVIVDEQKDDSARKAFRGNQGVPNNMQGRTMHRGGGAFSGGRGMAQTGAGGYGQAQTAPRHANNNMNTAAAALPPNNTNANANYNRNQPAAANMTQQQRGGRMNRGPRQSTTSMSSSTA